MVVTVRGAKDRIFTQVIKQAANSFANKLLTSRMIPSIRIHINITDQLDGGGFCSTLDDAPHREFFIELARTHYRLDLIKTLAHEMVHVKQIARGNVKFSYYNKYNIAKWYDTFYDMEIVDYWDQPWEIEAYGLENSLVAMFLAETSNYRYFRQRKRDWFARESPRKSKE